MRGKKIVILALSSLACAASNGANVQDKVTNAIIRIDASNDDWTQTNLLANPGDIVILSEEGSKIKVGSWYAETGADGHPDGIGALFIKIGASGGKKIGAHGYVQVEERGYIKLKINDTRYEDNEGVYLPRITIVPASLIPAPQEIVVSQ